MIGSSEEYEATRFWQHLSDAGLIPGSFTGVSSALQMIPGLNVPDSAIANAGISGLGWYCDTCVPLGTYFQSTNYGFLLYFGNYVAGNDVTDYAAITPSQAYAVDAKMDDGAPGTGIVQTLKPAWAGAANCATNATLSASYNTSYSGVACPLLFPSSF